MPSEEELYKAEKLRQLAAAIDYVLGNWNRHDDKQFQALHLQQLRQQRKTLLATFPPIRIVVDNTRAQTTRSNVLPLSGCHQHQGGTLHKRDAR